MNISKNTLLIIVVVVIVLFFYFGNGTIMNTGMNGRMNSNGLLGGNWFATIVTLLLGVLIGWLIFKKKN